jgi:conjugative relaxase-like TrwC/TraI family protein
LAAEAGTGLVPGFGPGQAVTEEAFARLCDNLHPVTGARLTVRNRRDRRVFYDFTVSAPKSASVIGLTVGDTRILDAHDRACRAAVEELERAAATRIRKGRARDQRPTGEIVAATFRHDSSRALDPQLHTHLVVFNATWDPVERRWKALEPSTMFDRRRFLTEVYRNVLAVELMAIGYSLRPTANGFEIDGVSEDIIQRFSKRSRVIAAEAAKIAERLGKPLTNDAMAAIAHATRQRKQTDVSSVELVDLQRAQLSEAELASLERLSPHPGQDALGSGAAVSQPEVTTHERADLSSEPGGAGRLEASPEQEARSVAPSNRRPGQEDRAADSGVSASEAIAYACDHVFERRSVAFDHEVLGAALAYVRGRVTLAAVREQLEAREYLVRFAGSVTTKAALREEQRMIALVNQGVGQWRPVNPRFAPAAELTEEQRHVVSTLLQSTDGVVCVRGGAGTGKTFTLKEAVRGFEAAGQKVDVFVPSAVAVEGLRKEGFAAAQTVQSLLASESWQAELRDRVLLVDEAGLLSNPQMLGLLQLARDNRCRLVLCGDRRQHSSVEAGDALRILEQHSALRTVQLRNIQRQTQAEYRAAVAEIAAGQPARAFVRLERLGAIQEVAQNNRYLELAAEYVASLEAGKSALIVTPTWRESEVTTAEVRQGLKERGRLGKAEAVVVAHLPLQWTEAQKRDLRNYAIGQVLLFHRPTRDFGPGEWGEVTATDASGVILRKHDGSTARVTQKQSRSFEVARRQPLGVAPGEQLLIQGNRREARLLNGQIVTVKRVESDGRAALSDGRTIPADFRTFNYGYCVTSPKSQGKTVDHMYVAVDAGSRPAVNVKQFYVSASRGRERLRIYTDDLDWLREQGVKSGTRKAAVELVEEMAARQQADQKLRSAESCAPAQRGRRL